MDSLTVMERKFVEAYNGRGDGTRAAQAAGSKRPDKAASEMLSRPRVQAALEGKWAAAAAVSMKGRDDLLAWWSAVMDNKKAGLRIRLEASLLIAKAIGVFRADSGGGRVPRNLICLGGIEIKRGETDVDPDGR